MSNSEQPIINDRYQIERRIGRGGMADVFLARDLLLDREVAIKVLFPEHAIDPNFVERFRREAQSVAGLNHPNIVGVYDWGRTGNTYFMAMEHVRGRTLAENLRRQERFSPQVAARLGAEIANALSFAHRNGVVHRDIKPANILVGDNGAVKVADFGIARAMDAGHDAGLTQDGSVMGTATYFSPEQAKGEALDPRSDLYSLGIVLYEMVAGRPPFSGSSALATAYMQVNDTPEPITLHAPGTPPEFAAIVSKCMTKNAGLRYANADELRDDLRRFVAGEPTRAWNEVLQRRGQAGGRPDVDAATTVLPAVGADPNATLILPPTGTLDAASGTEMMPRSMILGSDDGYETEPPARNPWSGAIVAGVLALAAGLFLFVTAGGSGADTVPDVLNRTIAEATRIMEDEGFEVTANPVVREGVADDVVYAQDPPAGATPPADRRVTLTYNPAAELVTVPSIIGLTFDEAYDLLTDLGLTLTVSGTQADSALPQGSIISQDPISQQQVAKGSTVKVVISVGAGQVVIPDVRGQTYAAAQTLLQAEPYRFVIEFREETSTSVPDGQVIRTDPVVGTPIAAGSPITGWVSSGSGQVTVPDVVNRTESGARTTLVNASLKVTVVYAPTTPDKVGLVLSQSPAAGTSVPRNSTVTITVGQAAPPGTAD
jgi:serine/threonine-protein kinase